MVSAAHQNELLTRQRCTRCAEPIPALLALRGGHCPHCESELVWRVDHAATLAAAWRGRAMALYALLAMGSLVAANIPLLESAIFMGALFFAHFGILRPGLRWLSGGRRIFARISLKLLAALIASFNLVLDVLLAPVVLLRSVILALVSVLGLLLYLELSMLILRRRIEWDQEGRPLGPVEWGVPASILGGLVLVVGGGSLAVVGVLRWMAHAEIPQMSRFAEFLLGG